MNDPTGLGLPGFLIGTPASALHGASLTPPPRALGWRNPRSLGRPHVGRTTATTLAGLPQRCTLAHLPPVYDQGQVGSCTANALAAAVEILQGRAGYPQQRPDRVALYYRERQAEGTAGEDAGAMLGDGVAALRIGYEAEQHYPATWGPAWTARPPRRADDAPRVVNAEALAIDTPSIAYELAEGHPVAVGLSITEAWETLRGGTLPAPAGAVIGGHALLLVGYDQADGTWLVRNSWGTAWGDGGYARLPWAWTALPWCDEAHVLRAVRDLAGTP